MIDDKNCRSISRCTRRNKTAYNVGYRHCGYIEALSQQKSGQIKKYGRRLMTKSELKRRLLEDCGHDKSGVDK